MTKRDLTSETAEDKFNVEAEAKRRGIQPYQVRAMQAVDDRLMRDIVSDAFKGISQSASMFPPKREQPKAKGNGWVDPAPLAPPSGIDHIDRLVEAQSQKERLAAIKQQIENDWIESHFDKGPRVKTDYNPFDRNLIGPGSDDE